MRHGRQTGRQDAGEPAKIARWVGLVAVTFFAAGPIGISAAPQPSKVQGERDTKDLEARIAALEALVRQLRAELEAVRSSTREGAASPNAIADLEKKIDALAKEIETLRIGEAAAPAAKPTTPGFGPAASKVYSLKSGVSIGGYGQMLYQNFDAHRDDGASSGALDTLDLERAVFYFGYKWTDRLLFNSEVEYEHAVAGDGEPGEVAVEFAYIDYRPYRRLGLRAGLLLVPIGFLSELHEPPIFHGALRPEVEQIIIPSTWRENGVGIYGDLGPVSYRTYLVAGLDATGFTASEGIREGRQEGADSTAEDLAWTGRLDYQPVPGLLIGASAFTGRTGQGDTALNDARLTLWDAHAEWNARGVHLRGLYAQGVLSDAEAVSLAVDPLLAIDPTRGTAIGSRSRGWYVETAYNLLSLAHRGDRELSPFVRYESLNTQAEVPSGLSRDEANDRTIRTFGVTYRPIPNVAIKVDMQDFRNRAGTGIDQVNMAIGYLF